MIGGGKIVGIILMVISVILLVGWVGWMIVEPAVNGGGLMLGIFLALLVTAPVFGIGAYVFRKGTTEESEYAAVKQEKKILNMVLTQGQVTMNELVVELGQPRGEVEDMIRDLVGKQLFSGAINWDKGILYSVESQQLTDGKNCPNCGSQVEFAGKGVIACPYCGSEVFLTKRAAASTAA